MLSLLFGLSMDYQVFLVSRMHEEWVHTEDNARAVRVGLAETSRVINSAAVIMICVFVAFVLSGDRVLAMFGIGLAGAVALDAFILRTVLVPALMHLFGNGQLVAAGLAGPAAAAPGGRAGRGRAGAAAGRDAGQGAGDLRRLTRTPRGAPPPLTARLRSSEPGRFVFPCAVWGDRVLEHVQKQV